MIAYNFTFIKNDGVLKNVKRWYAQQLLTNEQMKSATNMYSSDFYKPNLFIKIGLFIFTCFIVLAVLGLFILIFSPFINYSNNNNVFPITTSLVFAIACVVVLEFFIKSKSLYRSGIDEALLYASLTFLFSGLCFIFINMDGQSYNNILFILWILLPFTAVASIRYIDTIATVLTIIIVYVIYFLSIMKLGDISKLIMPFAFMLISAFFYLTLKKQKQRNEFNVLKKIFITGEAITLLVFYLACNYFVIRESSVEFFNIPLNEGEQLPMAWLFYILTAIVPIGYVFYGLKQKDKVLLWMGLLLVALSALTFKYYFSLGHPEISLTIGGIVMIGIAYLSIRYLKTDEHHITFKEEIDEDNFLKSNVEALVMVQSFTQPVTITNTSAEEFGGGGFGGGGSGSDF